MRPEGECRRMAVFLRTFECRNCTHVWQDKPGILADAFATGCPRCGSVYYNDFGFYRGASLSRVEKTAYVPAGQ